MRMRILIIDDACGWALRMRERLVPIPMRIEDVDADGDPQCERGLTRAVLQYIFVYLADAVRY